MMYYNKIENLQNYKQELYNKYNSFKSQKLALDMSRGKPCTEQLNLSNDLLNPMDSYKTEGGFDTRNYGILDGIPEMKQLIADMLEVAKEEVIIGGNSSLNLMYDAISRNYIFGVNEESLPWSQQGKIKFLCPSPGYDRHFSICEAFGIEMIVIDMLNDGPDMDKIEELVSNDESIKGIWCVPKYSNPTGNTYSDEVVKRFAKLSPKAKDFRIFWDNAYVVHHLEDNDEKLCNILAESKKYGNEEQVYIFCSTSKITFSGAGVSAIASSRKNIEYINKKMFSQTIGHDKTNQLRHVKFLKNIEGINSHMKKHADIIKPKFDAVIEILDKNLGEKNIAKWSKPKGGYFISLDVADNCAKKVVALAKEAGVVLTGAGATYPYGNDPSDKNIRIAPTFPTLDELKTAIEVLCVCVEIAYIENYYKN